MHCLVWLEAYLYIRSRVGLPSSSNDVLHSVVKQRQHSVVVKQRQHCETAIVKFLYIAESVWFRYKT